MKKILVVEDSETNMYLIVYILNHAGYEVIKAGTGEEGVALALQENPDLILMDIQLPGIDGLEATRRIRSFDVGQQVPIVALTSHPWHGERARAAGCTAYLEKPINPESFVRDIEAFWLDFQVEKS